MSRDEEIDSDHELPSEVEFDHQVTRRSRGSVPHVIIGVDEATRNFQPKPRHPRARQPQTLEPRPKARPLRLGCPNRGHRGSSSHLHRDHQRNQRPGGTASVTATRIQVRRPGWRQKDRLGTHKTSSRDSERS